MAMAIKDDRGEYRAGACNIGPEEVAQRRRMGLVFLAVAVGLAALLLAIDAPAWIRIAIWPPLAAAFITLEQVRRRFCVAFGMAGLRNFGPEVGQARTSRMTTRGLRIAGPRSSWWSTAASPRPS